MPQTSAMISTFASFAWLGWAEVAPMVVPSVSAPWVIRDLVPCMCHTSKVCSFILTGQTAHEVSLLCAWINTALGIRHLLGTFTTIVLKMLPETVSQYIVWGHSLWKLLPANLFTGTLTGRKHRKGENIIESNSFQNGMNE